MLTSLDLVSNEAQNGPEPKEQKRILEIECEDPTVPASPRNRIWDMQLVGATTIRSQLKMN